MSEEHFEVLVSLKFNKIVTQTEKAILFELVGKGNKEFWIPKSLKRYEVSDSISIPSWMVEVNKLEDFIYPKEEKTH